MRAPTALPIALLLSLAACDGGEKIDDTSTTDTQADDTGTGGTDDSTGGTDSGTTGGLDGESLYISNCSSCHGADAMGGNGGPPLDREVRMLNDSQLIQIMQNGEGRMPAIDVTTEEGQAIVDYLRTLFP